MISIDIMIIFISIDIKIILTSIDTIQTDCFRLIWLGQRSMYGHTRGS